MKVEGGTGLQPPPPQGPPSAFMDVGMDSIAKVIITKPRIFFTVNYLLFGKVRPWYCAWCCFDFL